MIYQECGDAAVRRIALNKYKDKKKDGVFSGDDPTRSGRRGFATTYLYSNDAVITPLFGPDYGTGWLGDLHHRYGSLPSMSAIVRRSSTRGCKHGRTSRSDSSSTARVTSLLCLLSDGLLFLLRSSLFSSCLYSRSFSPFS